MLWELGVIVEVPKGCMVAFPSALILHYNADLISTTDDLSTSQAYDEGPQSSIRGSLVFYTQARLFSMAALGETITEAVAKGRDATCTFDKAMFTRAGAQDIGSR